MEKSLDNLYIVLVEPKNAGNIGSTVRAMKNMGVSNLRLVNPVDYREDSQQRKLGYRSQEIIENSKEFTSLKDAIKDISLVFIATSKKGKWKKDFFHPPDAAKIVVERLGTEKIAVVFGREDSGVTIDEALLANYFISIPSAVSYPSLNLSQAVMVTVYDIYKEFIGSTSAPQLPQMAIKENFERLNENIWNLMKSMEFVEEEKGLFFQSLKRTLNRTHWTNADIAVFDRICKQVRWFADAKCNIKMEK
jgi:tRNA/rRNA methyltransferase